LERGPRRYTDIQTDVTMATGKALHSHTLSDTLKWLQEQDYVEHHQDEDNADYRLTTDGQDLVRILGEINSMYRRRRADED
jgi:DNA-binding HxlR family transcriptional regulator